MRRTLFVTAVLLLLAAGAFYGRGLIASPDQGRTSLPTLTVAKGDVEDLVSAVGTLQPLNYVDVGTQVSGQLERILVEIGDEVKEGDLLAELDPTVYEARVAADRAQLRVLQAQVAERQAQLRLNEQQMKRQKQLLSARATSQDAYDSAVAARDVVQAQLEGLQAQIEQTQSNLKADEANLGYTKIYAPIAGTVIDITARQGQTLNANQQAPIILRLADLATMTVRAQVSEADVSRLKVGMPAYFTTLGLPDRRRDGVLRQILPTPEVVNNVVLYGALFDVPNPDRDLLPQMSAQVFFIVGAAKDVPLVPLSALQPLPPREGPSRYAAQVVTAGGTERRVVELGVSNRTVAEVRSGLQPGDAIVAGGAARSSGSSGGRPPFGGPRL